MEMGYIELQTLFVASFKSVQHEVHLVNCGVT